MENKELLAKALSMTNADGKEWLTEQGYFHKELLGILPPIDDDDPRFFMVVVRWSNGKVGTLSLPKANSSCIASVGIDLKEWRIQKALTEANIPLKYHYDTYRYSIRFIPNDDPRVSKYYSILKKYEELHAKLYA